MVYEVTELFKIRLNCKNKTPQVARQSQLGANKVCSN